MTLAVRDVRLSYGDLLVLDGVSFAAEDGEFVGVTGPSGCGKTSLLQVLAGLQPVSQGVVSVPREELAFVFQRPMLLPWRTVLDNAAFGLECRGVAEEQARARAAKMLDAVGLSAFAAYLPHQLSEGMKQRLNLARAMAVRPRLVLLDEPFSALDGGARRELQDLLLDFWAKERFTAVFVSHWIEELAYLAGRIVVLSERPATVKRTVTLDLPRPRRRDPEEAGLMRPSA
mgnify:FL=1